MVDPAPPKAHRVPLRERFQNLIGEYGRYAIWVYFGIFAVVFVGFALAIQLGVQVDSAAGVAGTWGAAYLATKVTQPVRILATFALTPVVARIARKLRPNRAGPDVGAG